MSPSEWVCLKAYCTCAGSLDACACAPAPDANPAVSGLSTCTTCGHEVAHRRTCGECERYPCVCPDARRVGDALYRVSFSARLALIGIDHAPARLGA